MGFRYSAIAHRDKMTWLNHEGFLDLKANIALFWIPFRSTNSETCGVVLSRTVIWIIDRERDVDPHLPLPALDCILEPTDLEERFWARRRFAAAVIEGADLPINDSRCDLRQYFYHLGRYKGFRFMERRQTYPAIKETIGHHP